MTIFSGAYLPRNRQYQNLLDTVYYEIQAAKTDKATAGTKEPQKVPVGMEILRKSSSMQNVTIAANMPKLPHEMSTKANEASDLKKRPRLDRQIRQVGLNKNRAIGRFSKFVEQMSSSVSLDGGEFNYSERPGSARTSSANANEIVGDALRHAVEGETVRRQVASYDPLFDGCIL